MVDSETEVRALAAVKDFRDKVERHGLWSGAWVGTVTIRKDEEWVLFLGRFHLTGPGVRVPDPSQAFDATARDVNVRVGQVNLDDLWITLEELAKGETQRLTSVVGHDVKLHPATKLGAWSSANSYPRNERIHLVMSGSGSASFYGIFGFDLFERLGPQLRRLERPYASLREIAEAMKVFGGGSWDNNNASPIAEVSAEFPVSLTRCFFNAAHSGIEIELEVGDGVPLERLSVTVTPKPRQTLKGDAFSSVRNGATRTLTALLPCEEPEGEVTVSLEFDEVHLANAKIQGKRTGDFIWKVADTDEPRGWETVLEREFHWTTRSLRRRLRATLPRGAVEAAEWRIRESILLREKHPFFAVASAASVAEILLKERLGKVTPRVRAAAWTQLRTAAARMPRKMPRHDSLTFDHAIRLAEEVGLLGAIDLNSVGLLRSARNQIHLGRNSRPPGEDFSPVRASHAILATLDLCRLLGSVSRVRPKKRSVLDPSPP